jgi:hypothetical protein
MTFDSSDLLLGLDNFERKAKAAMLMLADTGASKMQGYAQENAPWTDRTGAARQRLNGSTEETDESILIIIAHGVEYGIFLELCNEKRFAIVPKTLSSVSPEIIKSFERLISKITK